MHAVLISGATRSDIKPHEIYNLAAQSHVGLSFQHPELTVAASGLVRTSFMAFNRKKHETASCIPAALHNRHLCCHSSGASHCA